MVIAYLPAMEVYGSEPVVFLQPHRVQVARLRLEEAGAAFATGFFQRTYTFSIRVIAGKSTVGAMYYGGYQVSFFVGVCNAIIMYGLPCPGEQVGLDRRQRLFNLGALFLGNRSSGVTFNTAGARARLQVATEITFNEVKRYKGIPNFYHF